MAPIFTSYPDLAVPLRALQPHNSSRNYLDTAGSFDLLRPRWHEQAACLGYIKEGKDWWFPDKGETGTHSIQAKRICETCPVKEQCLADAMAQGAYCIGIWGGLSQNQRKQLRLNTKPGPVRREKHGTQYSYAKRKCRCVECCEAHSRAMARYRARRKVA